jgi:BRCT domain type II-containing protein
MKTIEIDPTEKRKRFENYKSFVNRGGPDAPGSKTIPNGEKNCLKNLTFVITGKKALSKIINSKLYFRRT